ncbi:MAG: undecaprenyl-diphosphate phosphatase [Clostridia bacterium]|nr:undecaprenyl-diphosphate phosphatase [Clostridia bacterium]
MIEYIKIIIISLICGVTLPLPVSSAAHLSFVNGVLNFSDDKSVLGFYYSVMSVVFSAVIFVLLRKIYILGISSLFNKDSKLTAYRKLMKNLLVSLIPAVILFVPVGEDKLLCDLFDGFLVKSNILLVSVATVINALILVISVWYTRQSYSVTKKGADLKTVIRSSVYQIISYVIPGASHVSSAGTNMLICDVESKIIIREIYLYIAPQMLVINVAKIIRYILSDMIVNPVMVVFCVVSVLLMSTLVVTKMSKINIRRILGFFTVYGAVAGVLFAVLSFVLK